MIRSAGQSLLAHPWLVFCWSTGGSLLLWAPLRTSSEFTGTIPPMLSGTWSFALYRLSALVWSLLVFHWAARRFPRAWAFATLMLVAGHTAAVVNLSFLVTRLGSAGPIDPEHVRMSVAGHAAPLALFSLMSALPSVLAIVVLRSKGHGLQGRPSVAIVAIQLVLAVVAITSVARANASWIAATKFPWTSVRVIFRGAWTVFLIGSIIDLALGHRLFTVILHGSSVSGRSLRRPRA